MKNSTIYAIDFDENTKKQFYDCLKEDFVITGSLMPDAHSGYVAPIGSVLIAKDKIVPAWVGYDIGCGMIAVKFTCENLKQKIEENKQEIFQITHKFIPMGVGEYNHLQDISDEGAEEFQKLLRKYKSGPHSKEILKEFKNHGPKQVGTLGSGNHFIELGITENNEVFLVIHSGSRNLGHKVATYYMKGASGQTSGYEKTAALDINSDLGKEYLNALEFCLDFALLNRIEMAKKVHRVIEQVLAEKVGFELITNKTHNHAIIENEGIIHRKGATSSKKEELGVIPGNMRDGSFIVKGKGNKEFLESSSHGAGRAMSRKQAKQNITMDDFKNTMGEIIGVITPATLDESPQAYKNVFAVMNAQKDSVDILYHIKPLINWKG